MLSVLSLMCSLCGQKKIEYAENAKWRLVCVKIETLFVTFMDVMWGTLFYNISIALFYYHHTSKREYFNHLSIVSDFGKKPFWFSFRSRTDYITKI